MKKLIILFVVTISYFNVSLSSDFAQNLELIYVNIKKDPKLLNQVSCPLAQKLQHGIIHNSISEIRHQMGGSIEQELIVLQEYLQRHNNTSKYVIELKQEVSSNQYQQLGCHKKDVLELVQSKLQSDPWLLCVFLRKSI